MKKAIFKQNVFIVVLIFVALAIALAFLVDAPLAQDNKGDEELVEEYKNALIPKGQTRSVKSVRGVKSVREELNLVMNLNFKLNSFELEPQEVKYLDALGQALQDELLRKNVYRIEGYTCDLGDSDYNLDLSRKRAQTVVDYLVQIFQFQRAQFKVQGFGANNPVVPNITEEGKKKNRRVVIINTLEEFDGIATVERPEIVVKAKYARAKEEKELTEGDTLTSRDNYCIEFMPKSTAYVYIYQVAPSTDSHDLLFPNSQYSKVTNPVEPGKLHRLPEYGKWFFLDDNKGMEHIVVIAKSEELNDPDKVCARVLGSLDPGYTKTASDSTSDTPKTSMTRGMKSIRELEDVPEVAKSEEPKDIPNDIDMEKLFVWKLSFMHQ